MRAALLLILVLVLTLAMAPQLTVAQGQGGGTVTPPFQTATASAQTPAPTATTPVQTPGPVPTMYPTPASLAAGQLAPAMGAVMVEASTRSTQPIGLGILSLALLAAVFEVLRIFLVKRSNRL